MRLLPRSCARWLDASPRFVPTHVVPLGLSCRVAYQVRTLFASPTALPFDWWLTPIAGLTSYLENPEPQRIYGEGALAELAVDGNVTTIVAREFGFQLFHDFPRHDVGLPMRVVVPEWRRHVAAARELHVRRLERLMALDERENRLLFVRDRLDLDGSGNGHPSAAAIAALWRVLAKNWSRADVELLVVNAPRAARRQGEEDPTMPGNVRHVEFEDVAGPAPESWRGEAARWADAFFRAGYLPPSSPVAAMPAVGPPD